MKGRRIRLRFFQGVGHWRWIVLFAVLLLVSAAPVLADSPEEGSKEPPPPVVAEELEGPLPQEGAIAPPELAEFEHEEEQRKKWLASPEAEEQREESWQAFGNISAQESEELLRAVFSEQLEELNSDPARFLSDAHIVQPLEETVASVESEGEKSLLAATVPLRTEDEEGELARVDVGLEPTPEGYETSNALSDVSLPSAADDAIEVGEEGFSITQAGASGLSSARAFGDKNLLYPGVLPDTDLFVAPTATGAEIFDLLRSQESPEDLRFHIQVPEGAELRPTGYGGAEVVRGEEILQSIPAPTATDAQGTEVPVTLSVEENEIVLHVAHHGAEYAAPILVDPVIEDWANVGANWYEGHNWAALSNGSWQPSGNNSNVHDEICCFEGHYAGLMVTFPANVFFGPEQFGAWVYQTPNNKSYIDHAWITPYARQDGNCGSSQPHDYTGMLIEPGETWNPIRPNEAPKGSYSYDGYGMKFVIGMSSGPPGVWINCQRTVYAGGVALWMEDFDSPVLNSVTGFPNGWIKKDSTERTINVSASDEGFGVQKIRLNSPGGKIWDWNQSSSCTGLWGNRCDSTRSGQITYKTDSFPFEGEVAVGVQPLDPLGKGANSQTYHLFLDGVSPTINLSGQLAGITEEKGEKEKPQGEGKDELSLSTYNIEIQAKDGSPTELRSGVKEIKVYLDNKETPEETKVSPGCPQGSCPLTMNYKLKTVGLSAGKHTLKIVAVDWAGNEVKPERKVEFEYIPATGMKEEYVLQHIPLPDGHDHSGEDESHGPEIAVNVMNGNLVYHEQDFDVQASHANLELERVYNSQLPAEKDTQWGHGWSVAQTPELKPQQGESPPQKATATKTSAITNAVNIPTSESQPTFSSRLHAEIDKTASGYEVAYEGGAEVATFNTSGRIEEVRYGSNAPVTLEPSEDLPTTAPTFISAFGSTGSGNGQLNGPRGVAADGKGHVWVVDRANNRVEEFSESGEYLGKFGSSGSGNGQFNSPWGIAVTPAGNLWVADTGNERLQEFNAKGEFIQKFGTKAPAGSKGTELLEPEGIALAPGGMIWVADCSGNRVAEFRETVSGEAERFVRDTSGAAVSSPVGVAVDESGNVWVTEETADHLLEFGPGGSFIRSVGSSGSGNGQFDTPEGVGVGPSGNVYVVEFGNDRVDVFSPEGEFLAKFGTEGNGNGNFSEPRAIAFGAEGAIFVSDKGNNRVHRWELHGYIPIESVSVIHPEVPALHYSYSGSNLTGMELKEPVSGDNASVAVNTTSGLVSSVVGSEAGTTSYSYESGKLIAKQNAEGQTKFAKDSSGRLQRVTLPNGTWAEITYDALSRATEVTVDPAGAEGAKITHFFYGEEPRETRVWGGGQPEVIYSIGEDGSVFKWWYAEVPPAIDSISGSLWGNRNSTTPIENKDHTLFITGSSPHEIASVQVLVNGNAVVAEKTCEDKSNPPAHNCEHVTLEWITNAAEHTPGQLNLEVVVTDFLGHSRSGRNPKAEFHQHQTVPRRIWLGSQQKSDRRTAESSDLGTALRMGTPTDHSGQGRRRMGCPDASTGTRRNGIQAAIHGSGSAGHT
jgi:YD repeat-containing protein